jgi:predicted nucleic acid-binding protein
VELADTSAWTTRRQSADVEAEFSLAVRKDRIATCWPVRHELLVTARDANEIAAMRGDLDNLVQIGVGEQEWRRSEEVLEELGRRGPLHHRQVPLVDLLVAAAAEAAGVPVLHYDRHFELIASVTGQPVRAIAPLGSL